ncbi:MAG TPA: hypothetical protein VHC21_00335 [Candidatus Saccharimonadales bacterium]|nr:hypothetical protein [Candidatus Saccharimonadales bacterium]
MSNPNQAPIVDNPGVFERLETAFRNSRIGQLATIGIASLGVASAAEAYVAEPVGAENEPNTTSTQGVFEAPSKQECIRAGLEKPLVKKPLVMNHAGIRPFTPHHYYIQNISGEFEYSSMPIGCGPLWERVSHGQIKMGKRGDAETMIKLGPPNNPVYIGNQEGESELNYGPSHAWPDYLFNECENGKFQKTELTLTESIKNTQTHKVEAKRNFTLRIAVHGNCAQAKESEEATKDLRQNWGNS